MATLKSRLKSPIVRIAILLCVTAVAVSLWRMGHRGTSQTALLLGPQAARLVQHGRPPYPLTGTWTPSFNDVEQMEDGVAAYLDTCQKDYRADLDPFKSYQRQCSGIIHQGRRKIFVYGFGDSFPEWRTNYRIIFDGGEGYFRFTYDMETGKYEGFSTNGRSIVQ